ncbi:phosphate uptake regulator [Pseudonocardia eucalypti]|uniref:phosphate uptake regulator PhoU n=1 Tax=Pseudonocardia eucalypti TaxID=648755 RepID=UPI00161CC683|nr:phosphate uptake regulator [Pseudonocardia eucalypti]
MREPRHDITADVGDELATLCGLVCRSMQDASHAVLRTDPMLAEQVITAHAQIAQQGTQCARRTCTPQAYPPAIVERRIMAAAVTAAHKIVRMGELACQVADIARERHPQLAIPAALREPLTRMSQLAMRSGRHLEQTLAAPVGTYLPALQRVNDELDWLQQHLLDTLNRATPPYPARTGTQITVLARCYERFADHTVCISRYLDNTDDNPTRDIEAGESPPRADIAVIGVPVTTAVRKPALRAAPVQASNLASFLAEHPLTRFLRANGSAEWVLARHQRGEHGECLGCSGTQHVEYPCTQHVHAALALQPPPSDRHDQPQVDFAVATSFDGAAAQARRRRLRIAPLPLGDSSSIGRRVEDDAMPPGRAPGTPRNRGE